MRELLAFFENFSENVNCQHKITLRENITPDFSSKQYVKKDVKKGQMFNNLLKVILQEKWRISLCHSLDILCKLLTIVVFIPEYFQKATKM